LTDLSKATIAPIAHVFGSLPGEQAEGEAAVRQLFAAWASRWGALRLRPDGIRAQVLANAGIGWVGVNMEVSLQPIDRQVTIPLRALVVYQYEQGIWAIVHVHLSVGIPDELAE
jgi:ketosteroid isomerase-like protein